MSATRWRSVTIRSPSCLRSPIAGWTRTLACRARRISRRRLSVRLRCPSRLRHPSRASFVLGRTCRSEPRAKCVPSPLAGEGGESSKARFRRVRGLSPSQRTPHPPSLREGTFSRKGRRKAVSVRSKHEAAVVVEIRAGPHIELSVLSDEEQRALRHLLGALEQDAGIAGPHLVGKRLAVLAVAIAGVRLQLPRRRLLGQGRHGERGK